MAIREIPEGSVQIQTGLYLYTYTKTIGSRQYTFGELYSAEGYCFYWLSNPENYDEEGNLKPASERIYAQWAGAFLNPNVDEINADHISVPVEPSFEILSATNPPVTA